MYRQIESKHRPNPKIENVKILKILISHQNFLLFQMSPLAFLGTLGVVLKRRNTSNNSAGKMSVVEALIPGTGNVKDDSPNSVILAFGWTRVSIGHHRGFRS